MELGFIFKERVDEQTPLLLTPGVKQKEVFLMIHFQLNKTKGSPPSVSRHGNMMLCQWCGVWTGVKARVNTACTR